MEEENRELARRIIKNLSALKEREVCSEDLYERLVLLLVNTDSILQSELKIDLEKIFDYILEPILDPFYWYFNKKRPYLYLNPEQWIRKFLRCGEGAVISLIRRWDVPFFVIDKILERVPEHWRGSAINSFCPTSIYIAYKGLFNPEPRLPFEEAVRRDSVLQKFNVEKLKKFFNEIVVPQSHYGKGFEWLAEIDWSQLLNRL